MTNTHAPVLCASVDLFDQLPTGTEVKFLFTRQLNLICDWRVGCGLDETEDDAITQWVTELRGDDHSAVRQLWDCYFERLVVEARRQMEGMPRRVANEEDVAASVFHSLYRGATEGRFAEIGNRDDLWRMLVAITHRKAIDRLRHEKRKKRGSGRTRGDSVFFRGTPDERRFGFDGVVGEALDPEFLVMMDEEYHRLLGLLHDDELRAVAKSRMEGYGNQEIARQLGISIRSVARKVQLIRERWTGEVTNLP